MKLMGASRSDLIYFFEIFYHSGYNIKKEILKVLYDID
jgi:hypothetical protein